MALRTIIYRVKDTGSGLPGPILRAVVDTDDLAAFFVELTNDVTYQFDDGNGVWVDVMPVAPSPPPAAWAWNETFNSLTNGQLVTVLPNITRVQSNGDGGLVSNGAGLIRVNRLSGTSSFPNAVCRYEVPIGQNQEVEVDLAAGLGAGDSTVSVILNYNPAGNGRYQVEFTPAGLIILGKGATVEPAPFGSSFQDVATLPRTRRVVSRASGANRVIEVFDGSTLLTSWTDTASIYSNTNVGFASKKINNTLESSIALDGIRAREFV